MPEFARARAVETMDVSHRDIGTVWFADWMNHSVSCNDVWVGAATWQKHTCDVCQQTLNGQAEWERHLQSSKHAKRKASLRKRERDMERWAERRQAAKSGTDVATAAAAVTTTPVAAAVADHSAAAPEETERPSTAS